jgi:hypothetical protein
METRASLIIRLGIGFLMSSLLVGNAAAQNSVSGSAFGAFAKMSLGRSTRAAGAFCADRLNTDANAVLECVP